MTLTSTYDHRVIQGAESGAFLRRLEQLLQGEDGFYEAVAADLGIDAAGVTSAHPAAASAPPLGAAPPSAEAAPTGAVDEELLQAVQAATSLLKAYRTHGHLAAHLDPLGSEPKGDPALQPENAQPDAGADGRIPASILRIGVPGETLLEALPRMRDGLLRHDRLPVRAPLLPPAADLAAGDDRDRRPPPAARPRRRNTACCTG